jgi:hypothetical protein
MLVHKTGVFAGLLAESPQQFNNRCTVQRIFLPETSQSIQISRKGLQMKLYLKRVAPNNIASWPRFAVEKEVYTCYLAALNCFIFDK